MKKIALVLVFVVSLFALGSYASALAAPAFEDPQVCLNGQLLMIEPTTESIEVWLGVGPNVNVDFDILNCGGDPNLPVLEPSHVLHNQFGSWVEVAVKTKKHTNVLFHWGGQTYTKNSGYDKWIFVVKKLN